MRVLPTMLIVVCVSSAAAAEDAAPLWAALRAGGQVALVRHAATAGGAGDPRGLPARRLRDPAQSHRQGPRARPAGWAKSFAPNAYPSARC